MNLDMMPRFFNESEASDCSVLFYEDLNNGNFMKENARVRINFRQRSIFSEAELRIPKSTALLKSTLEDIDPEKEPSYIFYVDFQPGTQYTERPTIVFYKTDKGDYIPFLLGSKSGVKIVDRFHTLFLRSTNKVDRNIILNFLEKNRDQIITYAHYGKEDDSKITHYTPEANLKRTALLFNINDCNKRNPQLKIEKRNDTIDELFHLITKSKSYVYDPFDLDNDEDWDILVDRVLKFREEERKRKYEIGGYYYGKYNSTSTV